MTDGYNDLLNWLKTDPTARMHADAVRALKPGDMFPATQYDWERHQVDFGLMDVGGNWVIRSSVDMPMRGDLELFALYLDDMAEACRRKAKETA